MAGHLRTKGVDAVIPVDLQEEPANFDERVRQPGLAWLAEQGISLDQAPADPSKLPNYWTRTSEQLWEAYSGVCAYLSIYFEWGTGAASTDHFIAKSSLAGEAYEWNNFRLSCLAPNRSKNKYDDVIDPIGMAEHTFVINFSSGEISPNPALPAKQKALARKPLPALSLIVIRTTKCELSISLAIFRVTSRWIICLENPLLFIPKLCARD